jgi:hypothetical protein
LVTCHHAASARGPAARALLIAVFGRLKVGFWCLVFSQEVAGHPCTSDNFHASSHSSRYLSLAKHDGLSQMVAMGRPKNS